MAIPISIRTQIANALMARLNLITEFNYRSFDTVRLQNGDFQEFELPACQVVDLGNPNVHEMKRGKRTWNIAVEIIMGPKSTDTPDQTDLWDLIEYTENTIFAVPNLGVAGVVHMLLLDSYTDLHLMQPYYLGRIELMIEYYQPLVGVC